MRTIEWSEQARADIRRLDPPTAMRILEALARFAETGQGNVKRLHGGGGEFRLRVGDWRVRFAEGPRQVIRILRALHRSEAYR